MCIKPHKRISAACIVAPVKLKHLLTLFYRFFVFAKSNKKLNICMSCSNIRSCFKYSPEISYAIIIKETFFSKMLFCFCYDFFKLLFEFFGISAILNISNHNLCIRAVCIKLQRFFGIFHGFFFCRSIDCHIEVIPRCFGVSACITPQAFIILFYKVLQRRIGLFLILKFVCIHKILRFSKKSFR